jgi:hypothetical protein
LFAKIKNNWQYCKPINIYYEKTTGTAVAVSTLFCNFAAVITNQTKTITQ